MAFQTLRNRQLEAFWRDGYVIIADSLSPVETNMGSVYIALDPANRQNGGLQVLEGSHKVGLPPNRS